MTVTGLEPAPARMGAVPPWPYFAPDEVAAATAVLESGRVNYWTGGEGRAFELEFAEAVGARHAVALANGTVAIELALITLGVEEECDVIVTPRTFIASASAAVMRRMRPVFADVDRDSGCITAESIEAALTPRTRAIIPVHLAGWPSDMPAIMALAERRGLTVIEDCAQCHGATIDGRPAGSFGHAAAWSFCQDKIVTTAGEGGMLTTNSDEAWSRAWSFKDHGKSYDAVYHRNHAPGFRWLHESFGTNWRLSEVQSAVGRAQLCKLPEWTATRRRNAAILAETLGSLDALRIPQPPAGIGHAMYKFYTYVRPERLKAGHSRDTIMAAISGRGVPCFSGSCSEIYNEVAFRDSPWMPPAPMPVARELGETSLMFLVHPTLEAADMHTMAAIAAEEVARASA